MRRIWWVFVSIAVSLLVGGVGCDRRGGDGVVELRFWNGFTGPDGTTMLGLVREFNASHPDVHVVMQRMDWGTYYNKLFVAGMGGRAPEVFVSHIESLARFRQAGFVRPVDDLVEGADAIVPVDDLDANVWKGTEAGGKHWGVPLDMHPAGMFYNKRMFREAGIVDERGEARPPATRGEFLEDLRKIKALGGGRWGFAFTWQRINAYAVMAQFGGGMYDFAHHRVTMDSAANVAALDFCRGLVTEGLALPAEQTDQWAGFLQGRVGIAFHGIFMLHDLKQQGEALEWGAAPMPVLGSEPGTWASSHNLCLRADLSERELLAAKHFVRFISDHSLDWAAGGQVPVRKSLRATARFKAMDAQNQFAKQIPYAKYFPQVPFITEMLTEFDLAVEKTLRGAEPAAVALGEAQTRMVAVARRYEGWEGGRASGETGASGTFARFSHGRNARVTVAPLALAFHPACEGGK